MDPIQDKVFLGILTLLKIGIKLASENDLLMVRKVHNVSMSWSSFVHLPWSVLFRFFFL